MTRGQKAAETRRRNAATRARLRSIQEATKQVVALGKCPDCGRGLKRNLSLTGWWQCEQLGAIGFRRFPELPSCGWQGFTE